MNRYASFLNLADMYTITIKRILYTTFCMFVYSVALQILDDILNEPDER